MKLTTSLLALVLIFNILFVGFCSKSMVASVRSALKAAPILTSRLVNIGKLTPKLKEVIDKDFTDGVNVALTLGEELDDADTPQEKYTAANKAFQNWLVIYNRGNFGSNSDVRDAADIASGIFEFIDAYYADKAGAATHSDVGADGLSESEFKDALNQKIKNLEEALK